MSAPLKNSAAPFFVGELERRILASFPEVEGWLRARFWRAPPPFYCSVDLRNAGYKIAPIDTNLFPGGFNNLARASHPVAIEAIKRLLSDLCPSAKTVLLIAEAHSRNLAYLDNLATLKYLLESAGVAARIGRTDLSETTDVTSASGAGLTMEPVRRDSKNRLCVGDDFCPCAVLLNNDLSAGVPPILRDLAQPVMPSLSAAWITRRKSAHFAEYARVADEFAAALGLDPWLLSPAFTVCRDVDFHRKQGMDCLADAAAQTLSAVREKYRERGVGDAPFVVLKADAGTYGMGVMTVKSGGEVHALNRRQRNKMATGKGGMPVRDVLVQEGVRTIDLAPGGAPAEPVAYMLGDTVVGGFYRANETRASDENLNTRGMSFVPLPFESACCPPLSPPPASSAAPQSAAAEDAATSSDRLYVYGVIARLAALAAARELAAEEGKEAP